MYARMLHYRIVSHYPTKARGYEIWRDSTDDSSAFLAEHPNRFVVTKNGHYSVLEVTKNYPTPTLADLAHELMVDESRYSGSSDRKLSDYELLATVMAKGKTYSFYGSLINLDDDMIHLFRCGIRWERYSGVTDERWCQFTDTFNEPDYDTVLEAELTCRCDEELTVRFGLEPPSLSRLFVMLSAAALEELWD